LIGARRHIPGDGRKFTVTQKTGETLSSRPEVEGTVVE